MKTRLLLVALVAGFLVAGCGKDPNDAQGETLPPAKNKEQAEASASAAGGGQFNRTSDRQ